MRRKTNRVSRSLASPHGPARRQSRPQFEPLEDRTLMWGTPLPDGISYSLGTVSINARTTDDSAAVVMEAGQVKVSLSHTEYVQIDPWNVIQMTFSDPDQFFDPAVVTKVNFYGNDGNDTFHNDTAIPCTAMGNAGYDELVGGSGNDSLYGGDDGDTLEGRGGNDALVGGTGGDTYVFDGRYLGSDTVTEAANVDSDELDLTTFGQVPVRGGGTQSLPGGVTIDLASTATQGLYAGHLALTLSDGAGIEVVSGTAGADLIKGNARGNVLYGNGGTDIIQGLAGNDYIYGGAGNDNLDGGIDNDAVYGDVGNDLVLGGTGNDNVYGGGDADTVRGEDGNDNVYGGGGNDVLRGDTGSDHLYGDTGSDTLYGSTDGQSWLNGGDGDDTLVSVGNSTGDALTGGTGSDSFWCDSPVSETVDADAYEVAARHVHRIGSFVALKTDNGSTVTNYGSPGLVRNGPSLADPLKQAGDTGVLMNYGTNPLFPSNGPSADDIDQNAVGDCYFLAALSSIARTKPDVIRQTVADLGDGTYAVNFHGAFGADAFVRVDADLWANGGPVYAGVGTENSMWGPVIEKAYAFYKNAKGTYASISGGNGAGWTVDQALGITKASFATKDYASASLLLSAMRQQLLAGKAVTVGGPAPLLPGTVLNDTDDPATNADENTYRRGAHVYSLVSVAADLSSVVLRNPWATDGGGNDANPNDGYVTIPASVLFYCSGGFAAYTV
jgi:Ca2+-binding RTX toxin-like protein